MNAYKIYSENIYTLVYHHIKNVGDLYGRCCYETFKYPIAKNVCNHATYEMERVLIRLEDKNHNKGIKSTENVHPKMYVAVKNSAELK